MFHRFPDGTLECNFFFLGNELSFQWAKGKLTSADLLGFLYALKNRPGDETLTRRGVSSMEAYEVFEGRYRQAGTLINQPANIPRMVEYASQYVDTLDDELKRLWYVIQEYAIVTSQVSHLDLGTFMRIIDAVVADPTGAQRRKPPRNRKPTRKQRNAQRRAVMLLDSLA